MKHFHSSASRSRWMRFSAFAQICNCNKLATARGSPAHVRYRDGCREMWFFPGNFLCAISASRLQPRGDTRVWSISSAILRGYLSTRFPALIWAVELEFSGSTAFFWVKMRRHVLDVHYLGTGLVFAKSIRTSRPRARERAFSMR